MSAGTETTWLEHGEDAPFMVVAYNAKKDWVSRLPSVVHVDGSVRPQTVTGDIRPSDRPENRYRDVIDGIGKETGAGVVMNTSFNVRGEPIVCTPLEAIRCFMGTGLDALVIGDFLLRKGGNARG
jgi:carbamoyltransferase